jgi:tRNA-dihydrouridine synthase A
MLGRAAYKNPYLMATVDQQFFADARAVPSRHEIVEQLIPYAEKLVTSGVPLHALTRHLMGLYQGQIGGRQWRRYLSENAPGNDSSAGVLVEALEVVRGCEKKQADHQAAYAASLAVSS